LVYEERRNIPYDQSFLERDYTTILRIKEKYLEEKMSLFRLAHEVQWFNGSNSLLTNGLDELTAAVVVLCPCDEEEDLGEEKIDPIPFVSSDLMKLIYNIVLTGGGDFQQVVSNQ
jgi:hypothetical protein